jgi:hypothetical protein
MPQRGGKEISSCAMTTRYEPFHPKLEMHNSSYQIMCLQTTPQEYQEQLDKYCISPDNEATRTEVDAGRVPIDGLK